MYDPAIVGYAPPTNTPKRGLNAGFSLAGVLLLVVALLAYLLVTTSGELTDTKATLTQTQTDLANTQNELKNTQTQLNDANVQVTKWQAQSEAWRICGIGVVEAQQIMISEGALAALVPLGEAKTLCSNARTSQDALDSSGYVG